jgi:molecular chaperone DnaK
VSDPIVGIDLGTSNTVVAVCDDTGNARILADDKGTRIHPSVVSFHPNGSVVVGAEAKQRKIIDPRNTVYSVKRLIGRGFRSREVATMSGRVPYTIKEGVNQQPVVATRAGEFAIPEVSAIVLDHVRGIARRSVSDDVTRAVITVPANFNEAQRSATATAGAIAGLTVVRVLNEPTAAALAYGHARQLSKILAVYDFGGGTFDVTILKLEDQVYEVLGTAGDSFLGGDDLDERLVDHMAASFLASQRIDLRANEVAIMRLRAVAEQTKIELSRRTRAIVKVDEIAYGPGGAPLDLQIEVTRDELVAGIGDIVDRTFAVCDEALKVAGLAKSGIEDVVLVGGTTKIPHVRERVAQYFGKATRIDVNPEEAVAAGAALQAAALEKILSEKRTTAKLAVPPAPPLGQRPPTDLGPPGPRTTAPRYSSQADTGVDPPAARTTAPMGSERLPRATTQRPVTRGESIDVFEPPAAPSAGPPESSRAIGRITRPGGVPSLAATAAAAPPVGGPPPAPPTPRPPQAPSPAAARTLFGVAPGPAVPPPVPMQPAIAAHGSIGFEDETTAARTDVQTEVRGDVGPDIGPDIPTDIRTDIRPGLPSAAPVAAAPATSGPSAATYYESEPVPFSLSGPASAPPVVTTSSPTAATLFGASAPPLPVVLDVTPRGLGIGTVAGFCEELIRRNARVPTEIKRLFTTSHDKQSSVRIVVCQGESRRLDNNVVVGDLVLDNLEPRPRGETTIEVTFALDASGILNVSARDALSGREQRASLAILGAQSQAEVAASAERLRALRR